ncbi:MAG: hypothetical protein V4709_03130 [Pseudomonadota bacterium]
MRLATLLLLLPLTASAAPPVIRMVNEAALPALEISQMQRDYGRWATRVYRYHHLTNPAPVNLVISRAVDIGYYMRPNVYLPPDDDPREMLETFVHELAHHATGHESTFFFKEGIATATAEALFAEDGRQIEGWPQYGISTDAWVTLFMQRGELPRLQSLVEKTGYDGSSRDAEFRSWQTYIVGASFLRWLIEHEGYDTFKSVFWEETLGPQGAEWERRWLAAIKARALPPFDAAQALPQTARYAYYARRLRG